MLTGDRGDGTREQLPTTAPSVLVIDGDRGYRTLVEQELTAAGYQVLIVPGEQAGRRTLERGDVDVVVVDPSQADMPDV
jgi:DNA-binding response OmpR family regulator